jgi:hypothetical protein
MLEKVAHGVVKLGHFYSASVSAQLSKFVFVFLFGDAESSSA